MQALASDVTSVFAVLTITTQIFSVILILAFVFKNSWGKKIILFTGKRSVLIIFITALLATVGSLLYSEVIGYEPCKLCWFQRIFIYPQVILLGLALWKRDSKIVFYSGVLSFVGLIIAFYHYLLQRGVFETAPCSAIGYGVQCNEIFTMSYGYITIPLMSVSVFLLMLLVSITQGLYSRM